MMCVHFVEFYFSPLGNQGLRVIEIQERNPNMIDIPPDAYAFRFFDRLLELEQFSEATNVSGMFFPGASVFDVAEVPDAKIRRRLTAGLWDKAILDRLGNWRALQDDDTVI